jgi:hypothetical protein
VEIKTLNNYPKYEIDILGNLYTKDYRHTGVRKQLRLGVDKDGYLIKALSNNGIKHTVRMHRLVWETFVGEIPEGLTIHHKDFNKQNNALVNMELMTVEDNARESAVRNNVSKKQQREVTSIKGGLMRTFSGVSEAARRLKLDPSKISAVLHGRQKHTGGYKFI